MLTAKAVNKSQLCGYHTLHPPPWEKLAHHITSFKITSFITLLDKPKSISIHELQPLNQHHFLHCILHTQIKRFKKFTKQSDLEPHISDTISTSLYVQNLPNSIPFLRKTFFYAPGKGLKLQRKYIIILKHWKCLILKPLQYLRWTSTHTKIFLQKLCYNGSFYSAEDNQNLLPRDNHLYTLSGIQYSTYFLRGHISSLNGLISCYKISNGGPQKHDDWRSYNLKQSNHCH